MNRSRTPMVLAALLGCTVAGASLLRPSAAPAASPVADASDAGPAAAVAIAPASHAAPLRWVVAPEGNEARYRVREQLASLDFPNDAVGATSAITGAIVIESDGRVIRDQSKIVVDLRPLKSDRDRRDNYIQRRTLETAQHPTVELVPTAVRGLALEAPLSGSKSFELAADLTIKGVTKPTTWEVTATFDGGTVTGRATTAFTFDDFSLTKPRVASVLSVADTVKLEYDFTLLAETSAGR